MRRKKSKSLAVIVICAIVCMLISGCSRQINVPSRVSDLTIENIDRAKQELGIAEPTPTPDAQEDQMVDPYEQPTMWANDFHTVSVEFEESTGTLHFVLSNPNEDNELYNCSVQRGSSSSQLWHLLEQCVQVTGQTHCSRRWHYGYRSTELYELGL